MENKKHTTHFNGCDCVMDELESLRIKLNTCKSDYNFMINLIERYGTDKDQTLKDCLERMKFRKPMFETMKEDK